MIKLSQSPRNIRNRRWYRRNRLKVTQLQKEYRLRNLEKCKARVQRYKENNREKIAAYRKKWERQNAHRRFEASLKRRYRITSHIYYTILRKQKGGCALCECKEGRKGGRLFIDHCHKSKKVRGLLCTKCNSILGMANDRVDLLRKAIKYLK